MGLTSFTIWAIGVTNLLTPSDTPSTTSIRCWFEGRVLIQ